MKPATPPPSRTTAWSTARSTVLQTWETSTPPWLSEPTLRRRISGICTSRSLPTPPAATRRRSAVTLRMRRSSITNFLGSASGGGGGPFCMWARMVP